MSMDTRLAAFCEHVIRPTTADFLQIVQELKSLNIGITQETIKQVSVALGLWHITGEVLRALTYIIITWIIATVCRDILLQQL